MAERRMFAKTIIDSDAFLDMPLSTQALYFHLSMRADDDGFVNSPKKVQRMIGGSDDDFKLLMMKRFIIPFDSGVCVIKHWLIHNYVRKDRYTETVYVEEKKQISVKDNGTYTLANSMPVTVGLPEGNHLVDQRLTQDRLGKDRLGKVKENKTAYGEFENVLLTDEEHKKLKEKFTDLQERIENLSSYIASKGGKYKSHYATILMWARKDEAKPKGNVRSYSCKEGESL